MQFITYTGVIVTAYSLELKTRFCFLSEIPQGCIKSIVIYIRLRYSLLFLLNGLESLFFGITVISNMTLFLLFLDLIQYSIIDTCRPAHFSKFFC